MNPTPLNPEALEAAARAVSAAEREMHTNESLGRQRHIAERAVSAYLEAQKEALNPEALKVLGEHFAAVTGEPRAGRFELTMAQSALEALAALPAVTLGVEPALDALHHHPRLHADGLIALDDVTDVLRRYLPATQPEVTSVEGVYDIGSPEPEGVVYVVECDEHGVTIDYLCSDTFSGFWSKTTDGTQWKGYQDGKVYMTWDELVRRVGPVKVHRPEVKP